MHRLGSLLDVRKVDVTHLHAPFLAVLVHKARENVVVEALHAFAADTETVAFDFLSIFKCKDANSEFFPYDVGESFRFRKMIRFLDITLAIDSDSVSLPALHVYLDQNFILSLVILSDAINRTSKVISLRLLLSGRPCHIVVAFLGGETEHALHRQLVPVLLEGGSRHPSVIGFVKLSLKFVSAGIHQPFSDSLGRAYFVLSIAQLGFLVAQLFLFFFTCVTIV